MQQSIPVVKPPQSPFISVIDLECTKIASGSICQIGALRISRYDFTEVSRYESFIKIPPDADFSEAGANHYKKVEDICVKSPEAEFVIDEFLHFIRGPRQFDSPDLLGYCIDKIDLPLIRQFVTCREHAWIYSAQTIDVGKMVFNQWPQGKVKTFPRTQEYIATMLGIPLDKSKLHGPIYDCQVSIEVYKKLLKMSSGEEKKVELPKAMDPSSKEAIEWAQKRYDSGEFNEIACPYCSGKMVMYHRPGIPKSMDDFYYFCHDCGKHLNIDGTKGINPHKFVCSIEKQKELLLSTSLAT